MNKKSVTPPQFRNFASLFDLSCFDQRPDEARLIQFAVQQTLTADRAVIQKYVVELLNGSYSDEDLQQIWLNTGAGISFPVQGELRKVLAMIQDALR